MRSIPSSMLQRGSAVLEGMLALIVFSLLVAVFTNLQSESVQQDLLSGLATQFKELHTATATYVQQNPDTVAAAGVNNALSIDTLKGASVLRADFPAAGLFGGNFVITTNPRPTTCTPPNCDITWLIRSSAPLTGGVSGAVDEVRAGNVAGLLGGIGGYSTRASPTVFSGISGAWSAPNPLNQKAVVAAFGTYNASELAFFLRTDGSRPMSGTLKLANNNVTGAGTLTSVNGAFQTLTSTTLQAQTLTATQGTFQTLSAQSATVSNNLTVSGLTQATTISAQDVNATAVSAGQGTVGTLSSSNATLNGTLTGTVNGTVNGTLRGDGFGNWRGPADSVPCNGVTGVAAGVDPCS